MDTKSHAPNPTKMQIRFFFKTWGLRNGHETQAEITSLPLFLLAKELSLYSSITPACYHSPRLTVHLWHGLHVIAVSNLSIPVGPRVQGLSIF